MVAPAAAIGQALVLVNKVVDALTRIPDAVKGFVDALNPGSVRAMDMAFKSLEATVGYALEPIIITFTSVFRLISGEMNDAFTALRDAVADVANAGFDVLRPIVRLTAVQFGNLVKLFRGMKGVIDPLVQAVEGAATAFGVVLQIVNTLGIALVEMQAEAWSKLVAAMLGGESLTDLFVDLTVAIAKATDQLLRMVGATEMANKILDGITKRTGQGRPEGARDQRVTTLEELYRTRIVEAAKAQGGMRDNKASAYDLAVEQLRLYQVEAERGEANQKILSRIALALTEGPVPVSLIKTVAGALKNKYAPRGSGIRDPGVGGALGLLQLLANELL